MTRRRAGARSDDVLARLDAIRESGDRRASRSLLAHFLAPETDEAVRADVAATLCALEDVRLAGPLREAVLDLELPADLRSLALEIHSATPADAPSRDDSLARCRSSDAVVRAFGVRALDVADAAAIVLAASDPSPLVRYSAVDAMASIARTEPLVAAARRAFRDDDAAIREAACRVALFDEPLDVTPDLLAALDDESAAVRVAACDAIEDFPRVSVLLALADARGETESGIAAELAFAGVARRVLKTMERADAAARRRIERWCAPASWLLESAPPDPLAGTGLDDDDEDDAERGEPACTPVRVAAARSVLLDPDAPAAEQRRLLAFRSWEHAGAEGAEVVRACAASPNWSLRQAAAFALAGLRAADDLLHLARDREPVVRRAAFEELRKLEEPRAVEPALETLADPLARPTAGDEALLVVAGMAAADEAERAVLAVLGSADDRDGLWLGAIHAARRGRIVGAVPHLVRIAESPVAASVLPHVAALCALRELGRTRAKPRIPHLESLDHLEVQAELGAWGWRGGRYA